MGDSSSVLKDSRHPSHAHLHNTTGGSVTHRLVNLNRTQSALGEMGRRKTSARMRFYSETGESQYRPSMLSRHSSLCRRNSRGPSSRAMCERVSLIGSSELVAEVKDATPKSNR